MCILTPYIHAEKGCINRHAHLALVNLLKVSVFGIFHGCSTRESDTKLYYYYPGNAYFRYSPLQPEFFVGLIIITHKVGF